METVKITGRKKSIYINSILQDAAVQFGNALCECIENVGMDYSEIVLLCIGTDRATGDCLGPLTGYKLSRLLKDNMNIRLYGTLDKPVHAGNLKKTIDKIYRNHYKPLIIAIDACLGFMEHIGYLVIRKGSMIPGAGVSKNLPKVGDVSITGIVNFSGMMEMLVLQNTRLNVVMKMADIIAEGIYKGLELSVEEKGMREKIT